MYFLCLLQRGLKFRKGLFILIVEDSGYRPYSRATQGIPQGCCHHVP